MIAGLPISYMIKEARSLHSQNILKYVLTKVFKIVTSVFLIFSDDVIKMILLKSVL